MAGYFLSDGHKKWGPLTREDIFRRLDLGQISLLDLICQETDSEFLPIMNHPDFTRSDEGQDSGKEHVHGLISTGIDNENTKTHLKGVMSGTETEFDGLQEITHAQSEVDQLGSEQEWFVFDGNKKKGPYSFLQIVGMLAGGKIKEFDYVGQGVSAEPQKVAECPAFQPSNLAKFKETQHGPELSGKAFRRAHERYSVGKKILVYDREKLYKVVCVEMSRGGAGVLTGKLLFKVGDEILLKFRIEASIEGFDAKGNIVSYRKVRVANREERYHRFGVQFTALSKEGKSFLAEFVT